MVYIVIVDDEAETYERIKNVFESLGHLCDIYSNGETFLTEIEEGLEYDVAIIDRELPGRSGDDLVCLLKRRFPNKPIILCSGYAHPGTAPYDLYHRKGRSLVESLTIVLRKNSTKIT